MDPEHHESFDQNQSSGAESAQNISGIAEVRDRYLEQARSEEAFSAGVPEPYRGAGAQTRAQVDHLRRLAEGAEEIFTFEETLAGKAPNEIQAEIVRLQERIDQLVTDQREVQAQARQHDAIRTDSGQSVDPGVIARLDQEELAILRQSNLLSELKRIANNRLKG